MANEDTSIPQVEEFVDCLITIRWDRDDGEVVYDLGGIDDWSAHTILLQVADIVYENLPAPRDTTLVDGD